MRFYEGFEYIDLEVNRIYMIYKISDHSYYALVHYLDEDEINWFPVLEPIRLDKLQINLKNGMYIENTLINRILYKK